jgi:protein-S-isoprenylcysteine O-methyltransferase Ste14
MEVSMTGLRFLHACWLLFIFIWVISAFSVKPMRKRQHWAGRLIVISFLALTFLLLTGSISWWNMNAHIFPDDWTLNILGDAITFLGLLVSIWSRFYLGANWSAIVALREGHELIQRGPYRFVRHPMYTVFLLMIAGTAVVLISSSALAALIICFLVTWWKLRAEEDLLMKHFPDAYRRYRSHTKALIPFIF